MSSLREILVGNSVSFPVISLQVSLNGTSLDDMVFIHNGVQANISYQLTAINQTLKVYNVNMIFPSSGYWYVIANGVIQHSFKAVERLSDDILADIVGEALGSWSWDKALGTLNLFDQSGAALASYNIVENASTSSRELIPPN